jgi:hypothetical protein
MTNFYSVFADDHEHGSMRLSATFLDEYAAYSYAKGLSPSGDGIAIIRYQALNADSLFIEHEDVK